MTSAMRVSLLYQTSWLTTNSSFGLWYMRTHFVVSLMVPMKDPP
jgi:hypothetical protein